jgi:hypothetical protein
MFADGRLDLLGRQHFVPRVADQVVKGTKTSLVAHGKTHFVMRIETTSA